MQEYLKEMKEKGAYDYYAFPGGYPLFYITKDCGVLCPKCCNENKELLNDEYDPQWFIIAYDVNWEDENMYCDHCNEKIESAYSEED
mgnify:FL=1